MDAESWQSNLETWRERRRAASRALSKDVATSKSPGHSEYESKTTITEKEDFIREHLQQLKAGLRVPETYRPKYARRFRRTSSRRISESSVHLINRNEFCSDANTLASNSPFPVSENDCGFSSQQISPKQIPDGVFQSDQASDSLSSDQITSTTRVRLVNHPDCVNAAHLGMVIASSGEHDGPPFYIQDIVDDSMADKSHLRVGDELFSVDNLCCSRTPDRPLIVANLKKMHLLLDRLSARQRPVEVKVFRGRRLDTIGVKPMCQLSPKTTPPAGDRLKICNGEVAKDSKYEVSTYFTLPSVTPPPSIYDERKCRRKSEDHNGISLVENEKVYPLRIDEQLAAPLDHTEAIEPVTPEFNPIKAVKNDSAHIVLKDDHLFVPHVEPTAMRFAEIVKCSPTAPNDDDLIRSDDTLLPRDETPVPFPCSNGEPTIATPTLPPPPSALSFPRTPPPETPFSIGAISPPPWPHLNYGSLPPSLAPHLGSQSRPSLQSPEASGPVMHVNPEPTVFEGGSIILNQHEDEREEIEHHEMNQADKDSGVSCEVANIPSGSEPSDDLILSDDVEPILHTTEVLDAVEYDNAYNSDMSSNEVDIEGEINEVQPHEVVLRVNVTPNVVYHQQCEVVIAEPPIVWRDGTDFKPKTGTSPVIMKSNELPPSRYADCVRFSSIPMTPTPTESPLNEDDVRSISLDAIQYDKDASNGPIRAAPVGTLMAETQWAENQRLHETYENVEPKKLPPPKPPRRRVHQADVMVREPEVVSVAEKSRLVLLSNSSSMKRAPTTPPKCQRNLPPARPPRVNVIGTWYNCAGCNQQLGSSDLMIVEQLSLFYHLSCFVCSRCGIQLSDGQNETAVRIRNSLIYCYICYHRISKSMSPEKEGRRTRKQRPHSDQRGPSEKRSDQAKSSHISSNSSSNDCAMSPIDN